MKKFILAFVACLALGASAFAGGDDGFSFGYTYGIFGMDDGNGNDIKEMGSGIYLDYYHSILKFFGLDLTGYFDFPNIQNYKGETKSISPKPTFFGLTFMPTLNIPFGDHFSLSAGAGIGFMIRHQDYPFFGEKLNFNMYMFTFPVGVAAQFKFAKIFGIKLGCNFQFKFSAWAKIEDLDLGSIGYNTDNNAYFINPYIAFSILF